MKKYKSLPFFFLLSCLNPLSAFSQKTDILHTFKIDGSKHIPAYKDYADQMAVEYDSIRADHLYILEIKKNGYLATKTNLLFTGKVFKLKNLNEHLSKGELKHDGIRTVYREDESIASELLYDEDKLQKQIFYYPNGKKQMLISGGEKILNGEYKIWYPSGQLNFSGYYKYNLKNGEFLQFEETGLVSKKGIYSGGKLIEGEAVLQDIVFEKPEQTAKFFGGSSAFDKYLKMKTSELKIIKDMIMGEELSINMNMTISKTGKIEKIDILGPSNPNDNEILNAAFGEFPGFIPAKVEDIPVNSLLKVDLIYTHEGLQTNLGIDLFPESVKIDSLGENPYALVEDMPDFPGGQNALRNFIAVTIRYPIEAQEKGIQGKVLVQYIIEPDGSISNVKIAKGVHPILDAEAIRVVKHMPKWIPGRLKDKPVRVSYTVPVNFVLQ